MADLTGIDNVNEFFTQHYLDELLVSDLKDLQESWAHKPDKSPPDALRAVARNFLKALNEAPQLSRADHLYELAHPLQVEVAEALGYPYQHGAHLLLEEGRALPAIHRIDRRGDPYLLVVEGSFTDESTGALDVPLATAQLAAPLRSQGLALPTEPLAKLIAEAFALDAHPRWIVVLAGKDVFLAERARWGRGRHLRFDLSELLGRRDKTALFLTAALLSRDALAPGDGSPLHDTLDENSHKHAYGVSSDLKYAARKAVELLGNEWVHYQRTVRKRALYSEKVSRELTEECLVYLYRLLFLFYAEARAAELRSLPMNSEEYRHGYSLEALRDLELVPLNTPEARDGYFLHESLQILFRLVHEGHHPKAQQHLGFEVDTRSAGFVVEGVHSPLFDPRLTPRLSSVKLRNSVLQEILRLLSLSNEGRRGRGRRTWGRGRISYAQLGINQLGAVYEGLLSYTGFFARDTLYEVHKAGTKLDETDQAFFVPEPELPRYTEDELAFEDDEGNRARRKYDPGTFIFRLAGRDRETSASYYTPEVLTDCLVKYALKELLDGGMEPDPERPPLTADQILALTVCEPAMGSGAFLVEAIDQLAEAYLDRKQKELGQSLAPERYALERQKVATYIAAHNCYGVDLNPMAARLAGVSLWLATMHEGQEAPWLGARLAVGNSLVGARLAVWTADDLKTDEPLKKELAKVLKKHGGRADLEEHVEKLLAIVKDAPEAVEAVRAVFTSAKRQWALEDDERESDDESAAASRETERREQLAKDLKKAIADFALPRHHRKPPTQLAAKDVLERKRPPRTLYHFLLPDAGMSPFDRDKAVAELVPAEVEKLKAWRKTLSAKYDKADIERLVQLSDRIDELFRRYVEDRREVLSRCRARAPVWGQPDSGVPSRPIAERMKALDAMKAEGMAYARLKSVMDLWAAQWAWPLMDAERLPSRSTWWSEAERLLGVASEEPPTLEKQLDLMPSIPPPGEDEPEAVKSERRITDVVAEVCGRVRPFHWELEFPEVFAHGGGFDLIVGNPPWIKLQWNEQGILSDMDPRIVLDDVSASDTGKERARILGEARAPEYLQELEVIDGQKAVLNSAAEYPLLVGVQANLYKCFITLGWRIGSERGALGLLHQPGLLDDPRGPTLRRSLYLRKPLVCRFTNEFKLFAEVNNGRPYALSVSRCTSATSVRMLVVDNLFHPRTIDECAAHDGLGAVPGIKTDDNHFETRGHRNRLVRIGEDELKLFAALFDAPTTSHHTARLPIVHSREALAVISKTGRHPARIGDLSHQVLATKMWHEADQQRSGTIRALGDFPGSADELVLAGPHFYVGTPFYKTPRDECHHNKDYDVIDHETVPDDYLPRTNFAPGVPLTEYRSRMPRLQGRPIVDFVRHMHRRRLPQTGERTLAPALFPPGPAHVDGVYSLASANVRKLVELNALLASLPLDYVVRASGSGDLWKDLLFRLPRPRDSSPWAGALCARALRLNCLTVLYAALWSELWSNATDRRTWTVGDTRLSQWPGHDAKWHRHCALRNAFERRWALVEIDALAALELGLTIDELCTIYRTQFPVLREYEQNTWYDQNGRIVFTTNRGLPGVGHDRATFEAWQRALELGDPAPEGADTTRYTPPFETRDREADMRHAYEAFRSRTGRNQ